jgi:hypothetical protein
VVKPCEVALLVGGKIPGEIDVSSGNIRVLIAVVVDIDVCEDLDGVDVVLLVEVLLVDEVLVVVTGTLQFAVMRSKAS